MCPECTARKWRAIESQPPRRIGIASGAAYDDTSTGIREKSRARAAEHASRVRDFVAWLTQNCTAKHLPEGADR